MTSGRRELLIICDASPLILLAEQLRLAGWHIDERLLAAALKAAGETGVEN
jgi:hypothetical protein